MRRDDRPLIISLFIGIYVLLFSLVWLLMPYLSRLLERTAIFKIFEIKPYILIYAAVVFIAWVLFLLCKEICQKRNYSRVLNRDLSKDREKYHRNYKYLLDFFQNADPKKIDVRDFPARSWKKCHGLIFGESECHTIQKNPRAPGHVLMIGAPGTGKTNIIKETIGNVFEKNSGFIGSIFGIDIKPELAAYGASCGRKMKVFDPTDPDGFSIDPLYGVHDMTETRRDVFIQQLSQITIPDQRGDNGEFFVSGARDFFCGILSYLLDKYQDISFADFCQLIPSQSWDDWVNIAINEQHMRAMSYLSSYKGTNEKNTSQQFNLLVKSTRALTTGALGYLLKPSENTIRPEDLEEGYDIWLKCSQETLSVYSGAFSLIAASFMNYFLSRPDQSSGIKQRQVLFVLDELAQLSLSSDLISSALAVLRSKSVNVWLSLQSNQQLVDKWGDGFARSLVDMCNYLIVLSAYDPGTARIYSDILGMKKVLKMGYNDSITTNASGNAGQSVQEAEEPILRPDQLADLGEKVLVIIKGKYILADKIHYWE